MKIEGIAKSLTAIGAVVVMAFAAVAYFATDEELKAVEQIAMMNKHEMKIHKASLRYKELQSIKWNMDREFGTGCQRCSPSVMAEYQRILHEMKMLEIQLGIRKNEKRSGNTIR